ncbi:L-2-hydroxyglutarate oxidase [Planomonospora venezuelensis]|uniref:L-2-hydroxyglutarate oxidase LhgO n=1 Tax=Planomonospora venezuelensis TaxID=1999 RepID=A0A841DD21_PLAVE|nr:L-2-hydroxyglutarate oxidase [Planomonospora venezuelensis]MBB5967389.1 L-2-hydroxyglutarate oxidase LhgO [Planomonospora venezuelensis]
MADQTVGIIGAGIVGLAIGRELTRRRPGTRVLVLEKEERVAAHQTGHNSGVVHAGIYYTPGSLKARLCTRGAALLREYCADRGLPYDECGKLVVAVTGEDVARMDALYARAGANAVPGLRRIGAAEIREIEPHATGLAALHSPRTAITDYTRIAQSFADDIAAAGGEVRLGFPVTGITTETGGALRVASGEASVTVDQLIVCAGLHSDAVAGLAGDAAAPRIIPFRGEYMHIRPEKAPMVRGLIYPVPDPRYPFLGVHFTRRVSGAVEVGPNAVLAFAREGYRLTDVCLADLRGIASWPGMWRMAAQHWRTGVKEMYGSLSKRAYMKAARRYVPEIGAKDVVRAGAGVRAQALDRDGSLVDDFRIHRLGPVTAVRNAPSPAATSCMAIAEHVLDAIDGENGS